ncbi:MAG: CopG family transcriptional regulator [Thermoplasmata archaeon]|nr:CopG family transcriptional regulator [Thermoplasmata archaeon]
MPAATSETGRTIVIPEEIARGLEDRVRSTSFASIDAFVGFVLARLLDEPGASGFTEEEERRLRERLRSLGYID